MIGNSEAGLAETIEFVLKLFTPTEQQLLVDNVLLTGGCANFPGNFNNFIHCTPKIFIIYMHYPVG